MCTLVIQRQLQVSVRCHDSLQQLEKDLLEVRKQAEWPGTKLTTTQAFVYWYRTNKHVADLIKTTADRLYAWHVPDLPEDLAFYFLKTVLLC
jgi:hypothetical protein